MLRLYMHGADLGGSTVRLYMHGADLGGSTLRLYMHGAEVRAVAASSVGWRSDGLTPSPSLVLATSRTNKLATSSAACSESSLFCMQGWGPPWRTMCHICVLLPPRCNYRPYPWKQALCLGSSRHRSGPRDISAVGGHALRTLEKEHLHDL